MQPDTTRNPSQKHIYRIKQFLERERGIARVGCITADGWSAALGKPMLGITWHFVHNDWSLNSFPISVINTDTAPEFVVQLRALIEYILRENKIVGGDDVKLYTGTYDNEAAMEILVDLWTKRLGSVRCVVHALQLTVNDVFVERSP